MLKHPKHLTKIAMCPICYVRHAVSMRNPNNLVRCKHCLRGDFRKEVLHYLRNITVDDRNALWRQI